MSALYGGVGNDVGGIKEMSAAATAVVVIVPFPANSKKAVPTIATVVVAADVCTAVVRVGYPVDRSKAAVERQRTHNNYQRIRMVWYRSRI